MVGSALRSPPWKRLRPVIQAAKPLERPLERPRSCGCGSRDPARCCQSAPLGSWRGEVAAGSGRDHPHVLEAEQRGQLLAVVLGLARTACRYRGRSPASSDRSSRPCRAAPRSRRRTTRPAPSCRLSGPSRSSARGAGPGRRARHRRAAGRSRCSSRLMAARASSAARPRQPAAAVDQSRRSAGRARSSDRAAAPPASRLAPTCSRRSAHSGPKRCASWRADARRQAGALAAGRDGQQQVAAAHDRGVVEIAKRLDVLDVDQRAGGPRASATSGARLRERQVDDPHHAKAGELVAPGRRRRSRCAASSASSARARPRTPRSASAPPASSSSSRRRPARHGRSARATSWSDRARSGSCAPRDRPPGRGSVAQELGRRGRRGNRVESAKMEKYFSDSCP